MKRAVIFFAFLAFLAVSAQTQGLTIYCENNIPAQYIDENGKLTGSGIETVREIQRRTGNRDEIQMVPWSRGLYAVTNNPNTVLFSMARTKERNELYRWVGPIAESVYGLYVKADSPIRIDSLDDAKKAGAIGVYRDDVRDQFLTKAGFSNLVRSTDNTSNFRNMMLGRVEMYAGSSNDIKINADSTGYTVSDVRLEYVFLKSQLYIAFSLGTDPAVVAKWGKALDDMKADGSFAVIFKKFFSDRDLPGPAVTSF